MLKQFYIFCFLIAMTQTTQAQHLQLIENRGEIGVFGGRSASITDIVPDILSNYYIGGLYYKKQYNDYAGVRFNYEKIQLGSNDTVSANIYEKRRGMRFSRDFHDISLLGEFYFTRFLPGNKGFRFTPYLGFGIGYMLPTSDGIKQIVYSSVTPLYVDSSSMPDVKKTKGFVNFPVQFGFKYNLSQRWNFFAEGMYRIVNSDELDFLTDGALVVQTQKYASVPVGSTTIINNFQGSRSGKDHFFTIKAGISYNLIKIYGEEKWKPGKKSKLSTLKQKGSSEKKPGLFSRLKFNRK
jgi:hypothetical protein